MIIIVYCLAVLLFCLVFYYIRLVATCNQIIATAKQSVKTLSDKNLDDDAKEKATQAAAINMIKGWFVLVIKIVITFGMTLLPLWAADYAGLASFAESSEFSLRIDVLVITTVVVTVIVFVVRKLRG
jgi:hypothetical protein